MSTAQYIELVKCCLANADILRPHFYSVEGFVEKLSDISNLHKRLSKELEEYLLDPNYNLHFQNGMGKGEDWIRSMYKEIKALCKEIMIECEFTKKETKEFKSRIFVYYKVGGKDISALIYHNKKKNDKLEGLEL